jgi:hypothetical protein
VFVAAQSRAMLPVFWGISGSMSATVIMVFNAGLSAANRRLRKIIGTAG